LSVIRNDQPSQGKNFIIQKNHHVEGISDENFILPKFTPHEKFFG